MTQKSSPAAFSLVELLVVMSVMAVLMALVVPGISGTMSGVRLTSGTNMVSQEIQFARANALTYNVPVEVCFLVSGKDGLFRAMRSRQVGKGKEPQWVSRLQMLPEGVAFSGNQKYSPLLTMETPYEIENAGPDVTNGIALRIYPSGEVNVVTPEGDPVDQTDISSTNPYILMLGGERDVKKEEIPKNFAVVQINPRNGRVTLFRP